MATAILAEAAQKATCRLDEADSTLEYHCKRLRALGQAIQTLLPKDTSGHPVVGARATGPLTDRAQATAIYDLRDALIAARELAGMVDDAACVMGDQVADQMLQARRAIGLPDPEWTKLPDQAEGANHAR